jgi:hypothetical protein
MKIGKQANLHYGTISETITSNLLNLANKSISNNVWTKVREILTKDTWNITNIPRNIKL